MNSRYTIINFIVLAWFSLTLLSAQSGSVILSDSLPLDSTIRYGRLSNGFTYYIKTLMEPQPKLYLKFIVKAGGNQQDTDQLNISHALEHLAFRSSKEFPLGLPNEEEVINKLKMRNYKDFRAGNSAYYTQYTFDAPTNHLYALETGLTWFRDIATGLNLTEADIAKEKGALRQEFILRNGTNLSQNLIKRRLYSKIYPCSLDPVDFFEHNRTFQPEVLRRYYKDWYRPNLMALSIVGNIENVDDMEERIKETFSDIPPKRNLRSWKDCDSLYYIQPPQFVVEVRTPDSLKSVTDEKVEFLLAFRDLETSKKIHTMEGVRRVLIWDMFMEVLRKRLKILENSYNADFMSSGVYSYPGTTGNPLAFNVFITSRNGKEKEALKKTMILLNQFKKYGLDIAEWNDIKKKWINQLDNLGITNAGYWHEEILNNFIFEEALPNDKRTLLKQFLNNLSLRECNNRLMNLFSDMPEDIGLIAPSGHRALLYTKKEIRSWIKEAFGSPVEPYVMEPVPYSLIGTDELSLLKERTYIDMGSEKFGARKFVLDNGVKIILKSYKPSSGLNMDKIMLHGFSNKGANCFPEEDYFSAINAPDFIKNSGVGNLDKFELNNLLLHTSMWQGVIPYINYKESGVKGVASVEDFEKMLQLIYLYFTKPRKSYEAFNDWKRNRYNDYHNPSYGLVYADFDNAIKEIIGDSTLLFPSGTKHFKGLQKTDLEKGHKIYKELFSNARDFTFLISGDFAIDFVLPMVQKYLGNLPNMEDSFKCIPKNLTGISLGKGPVFERIPVPDYGMKNVSYAIKYIEDLKKPFDWRDNIKIQLLGSITNDEVWKLRHDKGYALYDIIVYGRYSHDQSQYQINLKLDCEMKELKTIQNECNIIFSNIRLGRINDELIQVNKKRLLDMYSVDKVETNGQIQQRLYEYYKYHLPWMDPIEVEQYIESISIQHIIEMADIFYKDENRYEFVMGS